MCYTIVMSRHTERRRTDPSFDTKVRAQSLAAYRRTYADPIRKAKLQAAIRSRYARNVPRNMLKAARKRAVNTGVPCTITLADIIVPETCPILGVTLQVASGGTPADNSPSLDRLVPHDGYVSGNVAVISYLA